MPVIKIYAPKQERPEEDINFRIKKLAREVLAIEKLYLTDARQLSIFLLPNLCDGSENIVVEVLLDKKPERTKRVLKFVAKIVSDVMAGWGPNEVFVTAFNHDHEETGFFSN